MQLKTRLNKGYLFAGAKIVFIFCLITCYFKNIFKFMIQSIYFRIKAERNPCKV